MPGTNYDVIVIGVGSMGVSSCYFLATRGYKVLGIEQFELPHDQGAHAGQSRIIRKAYFEHPDYVPLLKKAYENWQQLEEQTGEQVYFKTGLLYQGPADHVMIKGVKEAALLYGIELEQLTIQKSLSVFPRFVVSGSSEVIYEPDAGFIRPEKIISLYKNEAEKKGAAIHTKEIVLEWKKEKGGITVITDRDTYHSEKLIITAGAWSGKMLPQLASKLTVTRQVIVWVKTRDTKPFEMPGFPCWLIADNKRGGALYGFPFLRKDQFGEPEGIKFAWHYPGDKTKPEKVNRQIDKSEIDTLIRDVAAYIPALSGAAPVAAKTCLYTNSPDENFIIDYLPGYERDVVIACGFSGHGFKFVSVAGEILADLAIKGESDLPVDFLSLGRFQ